MRHLFIGDLSSADVNVLSNLVSRADRILEFGAGGSTQIAAQFAPRGARIVTVDTSPEQISRTIVNLGRLGVPAQDVEFLDFDCWMEKVGDHYFDMIFDNGADALRRSFAHQAWPMLRIGGVMVFHSTRRETDIENVLDLIRARYLEVDSVEINTRSSNITVIRKKTSEPWVNWNTVQSRLPWEVGDEDPPEDWPNNT
jgi:predicted O-methyltransferase YrrM